MNSSFYLICFGVLGCYAGLRTVRAAWMRGVIVIFLVGCLIHLLLDAYLPWQDRSDPRLAEISRPEPPGPYGHGVGGFFERKLEDIEADRCVLNHLKATPISPLVYVVELHSFLRGYKRLQSAQMSGANNFTNVNTLFGQTFGDTASALSPQEAAAVSGGDGNLETLCAAFGKWTDRLAQKSEPEQKQIWQSFQSSVDQDQ